MVIDEWRMMFWVMIMMFLMSAIREHVTAFSAQRNMGTINPKSRSSVVSSEMSSDGHLHAFTITLRVLTLLNAEASTVVVLF